MTFPLVYRSNQPQSNVLPAIFVKKNLRVNRPLNAILKHTCLLNLSNVQFLFVWKDSSQTLNWNRIKRDILIFVLSNVVHVRNRSKLNKISTDISNFPIQKFLYSNAKFVENHSIWKGIIIDIWRHTVQKTNIFVQLVKSHLKQRILLKLIQSFIKAGPTGNTNVKYATKSFKMPVT